MAVSTSSGKIEALIGELESIQLRLKQNLFELHKNIDAINQEPELQQSLNSVKKDAETRASGLEAEVKQLRLELKLLRELLGLNLGSQKPADS